MWVWKKNISKTQEDTWQQRMSAMPGAVFSEGFQAERLNLDVYVETEGEAVLLQKCYGGKLEEVKTVDWVAATAPENTPPLIIRDKIVISASEDSEVLAALQAKYPERILLVFPAERAFGTGNHATTSTCLRMLCDEVKNKKGSCDNHERFRDVLDRDGARDGDDVADVAGSETHSHGETFGDFMERERRDEE